MSLTVSLLASEAAPLSKTGGLADVSGALTKYLHAAGHDVRLFTPLYSQVDRSKLEVVPLAGLQNVPLRVGSHHFSYGVARTRIPGSQAEIYLVDCPALFARE